MGQERSKIMIIKGFIFASSNQPEVGFATFTERQGLYRLLNGVYIHCFRIVDVANAIDFGHGFEAMRAGLIGFQGENHLLQRNPEDASNGQGSHDILGVVRTRESTLIHVEERSAPVRQGTDEQTAVEVEVSPAVLSAESDEF